MTVVDFTPIINSVLGLVFVIVSAAICNFLKNHMKDQAAEATLQTALMNGLGAMQQAVQKGLISHPIQAELPGITAAMGAGIQYVCDHAGDAVLHQNLSKEEIGEKLDARQGVKNMDSNIAAAASPSPSPAPMAPVPPAFAIPPAPTSSSRGKNA